MIETFLKSVENSWSNLHCTYNLEILESLDSVCSVVVLVVGSTPDVPSRSSSSL